MLAKHVFEDEKQAKLGNEMDPLDDLNATEKQTLNEWQAHFDNKYIHVGNLVSRHES